MAEDVRQPDDVLREAAASGELDKMTKAELLALASQCGVDIPPGATKDNILAALGAH